MQITRTSPIDGVSRTIDIPVTAEQLAAWEAGACIQSAMPNISVDHREFIMSGITGEQWDALFSEDEDE